MRNIVIFYSKSGNTLVVADAIKQAMQSHTQEITDYTNNRTLIEYLFPSLIDSASIEPRKLNVDYYETIFIGTPVWFGSITPAIKKIIDNIDFKNKDVILFTTFNGLGGELAINKMAKLVRKQNGNIRGAFSIISTGTKEELIINTNQALRDLNLIE